MSKEHPNYTRARAAFEKAGKDTAIRARQMVCGADQGPDQPACMARGFYRETYRGTSYHFVGSCDAGHKIERFGYADKAVKD